MKEDEVTPVGIARESGILSETGTPAVRGRCKKTCEPKGEFIGHLLEIEQASRSPGTLDSQHVAVKEVVAFQRFDQEIIDREPDGATPVRVPAEEAARRFTRDIVDAMRLAADLKDVGMIPVHA